MINIDNIYDDLVALRHTIHKTPEVGFDTNRTRHHVESWCERFDPDRIVKPGGGLLVSFFKEGTKGIEDNKGGILLRAELDALAIPDLSGKPYTSTIGGFGHQCGHDGHTTILCGVVAFVSRLKQEGALETPVHFIFQPAEEQGRGARAVLSDPIFDIEPEHTLSLHNVPGLPFGEVFVKDGDFTPSVISLDIALAGAEAHAAQPDTAVAPHRAIAEIIRYMDSQHKQAVADQVNSEDFPVAPIFINMGDRAYGTTAGQAQLGFTMRHCDPDQLKRKQSEIETELKKIASKHDLELIFNWHEAFEATQNNSDTVDRIRRTSKLAGLSVVEQETPFPWGEDYGLFTQAFDGAMFVLGAGEETPPLHRPEYDFPDQIIPQGISAFSAYIIDVATSLDITTEKI